MSQLSRRTQSSAPQFQEEVRPFDGLERIQPHAAGVDIGVHEIMVCVPGPDSTQIVCAFGTYTVDLAALADWLAGHAALTCSNTAFGSFYRRLRSRVGPSQALVATAHKLARVVYKMLKDKISYTHTTAQEEDARFRDREIAYLKRKAAKLGLVIAEPVTTLVS